MASVQLGLARLMLGRPVVNSTVVPLVGTKLILAICKLLTAPQSLLETVPPMVITANSAALMPLLAPTLAPPMLTVVTGSAG